MKCIIISLLSISLLVLLFLLMTNLNFLNLHFNTGGESKLLHSRQVTTNIPNGSLARSERKGYGITGNASTIAPAALCRECEFLHSHHGPLTLPTGSPPPALVRVTSTKGYGRTGNYVISMFLAMKLAYLCKSTSELPGTDERGTAFHFQKQLFDFTQRPGNKSASILCKEEFVGNARKFWFLTSNKDHETDTLIIDNAIDVPMNADVERSLWACMRQYLGLCVEGFCANHKSVAQDGVLVVHLRQGDIYKSNYSGDVHRVYQQPFLAYYYSIINFTNPEKVIFVGEGGNHGPIWDAFEDLQSFRIAKFAIELQSSSLTEDLRTMVCARKFVESNSTLMKVIRLGFATQRFSHYACESSVLSKEQQVYHVDAGEFNGGQHFNSAEEWVAMLLHGKASLPRLCRF